MKVLTTAQRVLLHAHTLGYRVDDDGTCRKPDGSRQRVRIDSRGYLSFTARCGETRSPITVHRLAAIQRFGADALFADGIQVRHLNNNKRDNSLANIAIGSHLENYRDNACETNRRRRETARESTRRLSDADVLEILRKVRAGGRQRRVAVAFGVSVVAVNYICTGRTYSDVTGIVYTPRRPNPILRKLSDEQARDLVTAYFNTDVSQAALAQQFDISEAAVSFILRGQTYAAVTADIRQLYSEAADVANDTTREACGASR